MSWGKCSELHSIVAVFFFTISIEQSRSDRRQRRVHVDWNFSMELIRLTEVWHPGACGRVACRWSQGWWLTSHPEAVESQKAPRRPFILLRFDTLPWSPGAVHHQRRHAPHRVAPRHSKGTPGDNGPPSHHTLQRRRAPPPPAPPPRWPSSPIPAPRPTPGRQDGASGGCRCIYGRGVLICTEAESSLSPKACTRAQVLSRCRRGDMHFCNVCRLLRLHLGKKRSSCCCCSAVCYTGIERRRASICW
jgi:hypothetical protein